MTICGIWVGMVVIVSWLAQISWKTLRLCRIEGLLGECLDDSEFNYNNNKMIVTLRDQDSLQLFVHLTEYRPSIF